MNLFDLTAQALGLLGVALGFACFQMRTQKRLLLMQMATIVAFCAHYAMIGATSGLVLNLLGVVRNLAYCFLDRNERFRRFAPWGFAVVMGAGGLLSWQGPASAFVVSGVVIHTLCLSFSDPQKIRKSVLISSPLLFVYNAIMFSVGGMVYEGAAIVSSVIGIARYRGEKK